jgi:hypothetical protein
MKSRRRVKQKPKASTNKIAVKTTERARPVLSKEWSELEQNGTLYRVAQLRLKCNALREDRDRLLAEIATLSNWTLADKFVVRMHQQGRRFTKVFQGKLDSLHKRVVKLDERIEETFQKIVDLGGSFVPQDVATERNNQGSTPAPASSLDPQTEGHAGYRDSLIRRHANLSNEDICRRLDLILAQHGGAPSLGLPEKWTEDCGVKTYTEAFKNSRTKNRVQKLIWKAKQSI